MQLIERYFERFEFTWMNSEQITVIDWQISLFIISYTFILCYIAYLTRDGLTSVVAVIVIIGQHLDLLLQIRYSRKLLQDKSLFILPFLRPYIEDSVNVEIHRLEFSLMLLTTHYQKER